MPHEKRAPLGYFEYPLNSGFKHEDHHLKYPSSSVSDNSSDWSSQLSSRPSVSRSSVHTTPDSIGSSYHPIHHVQPDMRALQNSIPSVDVPAWREGVEDEKNKRNMAPILPPLQRQHPRRTAAPCPGKNRTNISPPPTLVRQPEKKLCFVSSLVIFAAGLIAAIWPLSAPVLHDTTYAHNVLPLQDFITETLRRSKTSYSTLQVAMFYLILLKDHLPRCDFTREQSCLSSERRVMQCGRRMFLSALMLASKFLQDRNYSTRAWGKITGLPTSEINANELKFLNAVDWKIHVSKEKFERWSHAVIALSAPPKPGLSPTPQPSLVETLGWGQVLDRLTPDCREDFSYLGACTGVPPSVCSGPDAHGMLTPPSSPPDSTESDQDDPSNRPEAKYASLEREGTDYSGATYPAPPPPPQQQNLPTPSSTPGLSRCPSLSRRTPLAPPRCRESSSALSMLKLCARPANRALCPPPPQRRCQAPDQSAQSSTIRRCSSSSSGSGTSSPESIRSEFSGYQGRSRSSSISSVASSALPAYGCVTTAKVVAQDDVEQPYRPRDGTSSKVDCSLALRSEEYGAADALLRFHTSAQGVSSLKKDAASLRCDSTKPEVSRAPKERIQAAEKQRKKRTHSKTNGSDITVSEEDLQALVRRNLMPSCNIAPDAVIPDLELKDAGGRPYKRNRSTKEQMNAADLARVLLDK